MSEETEKVRAIDRLAKRIKDAYKRLVSRVVGSAKVSDVAKAVERGPEAVADLVPLGQMPEVTEAVRSAYVEGGSSQSIRDPRGMILQFDPADASSARWVANTTAEIVLQARTDQLAAIFAVIQSGMQSGKTPNDIALDILGRINRQTGQRVGGVIGLTGYDADLIMSAYDQLRSGDPEQLAAYLSRKDRIKLFDTIVKQAKEAEKAVPVADAARIQAAYAQVKLDRHNELIASHQAHQAYNAGIHEMYQQLNRQDVRPSQIVAIWRSKGDDRVRPDHRRLNGQSVPLGQAFSVNGQQMRYPGDTSLGAGWKETANCRCVISHRVIW